MLTLRPYQHEAIERLMASLHQGEYPVCSMPTGSGKTILLAELCNRLEGRILIVTHRRELIQQNHATIETFGHDSGIYSAGLSRRDTDARVIVAGVASIYKRMAELQASGPFRYVILDECHVGLSDPCGNMMGDHVLHACWHAQRVGLSATPYRLPDVPVWGPDMWFTNLASHHGILELTEQGYLCRLVGVQTAAAPNLEHVRVRGGDYALGDLSQASSEESVVNAALDEILYLAQDRKHVLLFAVDVSHAGVVAEAMRERGEAPEVVTGTTPSEERAEILTRFKSGSLRWLINVGVLSTGFDSPNVDSVAILRSTMSRSLFTQMIGRASRLHPEKANALILDCGQNIQRHAPIDGIPRAMRSPALAEVQAEAEKRQRAKRERERKVRHEAMVAVGIDPLGDSTEQAEVVHVERMSYALRPASKYPGRQNLLVSYRGRTAGGRSRSVTQFVLLQYPGRPKQEAMAWFLRRGMAMPAEPRRALAMAWDSPVPETIVVQREGPWDRLIMERFRECE